MPEARAQHYSKNDPVSTVVLCLCQCVVVTAWMQFVVGSIIMCSRIPIALKVGRN